MNYQTLLDIPEQRMHRPDLSGLAPSFVAECEAMIAQDVWSSHQIKRETWSLTSAEYALPEDWIGFRSVPLDLMAPQRFHESIISTETGPPESYTVDGRTLLVAPFPGAHDLDVTYRARLPKLVDPTDTNFLLSQSFNLYLNAVCACVASQIEDLELEAKYAARYISIVQRINGQQQWGQASGNTMRSV